MNDEIDVNLTNKSLYNFQENDYIKELVDEYDHDQKFDNNITAEKTSLYRAIEIGNIEIVKLLLMNRKIDVNIKNKYYKFANIGFEYANIGISSERTALNHAIINENIEIIKLLLLSHNSIDVNLCDCDLYYAEDGNSCDAIFRKTTPLVFAIKKGNIEIVKILLMNNEIDVNAKISFGVMDYKNGDSYDEITPLSVAIKHKNIDIVSLLLMNKKLDLNSSSINYEPIEDTKCYFARESFTELFKEPDLKRFVKASEEENSILLKNFAVGKKIDQNTILLKYSTEKLLK